MTEKPREPQPADPTGRRPSLDPDEGEELGGDPACWLDKVCQQCGRFVESGSECPACGAPLVT